MSEPTSSTAAHSPSFMERVYGYMPKGAQETLKNLDGDTLKKVGSVGLLILPFMAPALALTAVLLAIPAKIIIDGQDQTVKPKKGEKSLYDALGDIMTLGTAILMVTPASISMGIVALAVSAGVILPSSEKEGKRRKEDSEKQAKEINQRGWMIYTAESICGYSIIQAIANVANMTFSATPHIHLLTAATYLLIAKLSKSYAEKIEKELGIDLDEGMYDKQLARDILSSAPVQWVRTKVNALFNGKSANKPAAQS